MEFAVITGSLAGIVLGFAACYVWFRRVSRTTFRLREDVLQEAQEEAEKIASGSKEEARKIRDGAEKEIRERREELKLFENRLVKKEDVLEKRADSIQGKERNLEKLTANVERRDQSLRQKEAELNQIVEEEKQTLHRIAALTREEAIQVLMSKLEPELEREKADLIRKSLENAKESAESEAKRIISMAISRYAAEHTTESVVTVVDLPNEEMKGRIIGREGRNIRAFERATGVDVIVDDTPGVIVLSSFDGVRREMARRAMERLILDGRIHPSRIEEITEQTKREMEEHITKIGKDFLYEQNIQNAHPKLITLIGRLRYRSSYGQNVLQHVREVAELSAVMAAEMGRDPKIARRCGIFHDIGKAVDQEFEGSHPVIGGELLKRFDESREVIDAATNHHSDQEAKCPYTVLTAAADAISASRPGARGESLERYVKRLEKLEAIAKSMDGVTAAYAIQAGREIRVMADSERISDDRAIILARDIANQIERDLTYPGEIRVTVLRETRVVEYAR